MQRNIIKYLNTSLLALCLLFALSAAFMWLCRPSEIEEVPPQNIKGSLPKGAFRQPEENYLKVGESALSLNFQAPTLKLPDLKNILIYYGKNGRPDAQTGKEILHFSLAGGKDSKPVSPGGKLFLVYNKKNSDGNKYSFSPENEPTSLWIEPTALHQEAQVKVRLLDDKGGFVESPEQSALFNLPEKEFARNMTQGWEIGKWRVDATILARQKARWVGHDRFLEEHGGEEYKDALGRQRVDFSEGDETYSLFVKVGDSLIYKDDRWQVVQPGENSLTEPLLVVKRVDDRLMNLELWDVQGKGKISLNLLKTTENFAHQNFDQMFKFLGARTRSQFVFEIESERMLLRPKDWLLLTEGGWKKLSTPQEIDDYVDRKLTGTLFVFDEIIRKEERQVMKGTVYNQSRTEAFPVELAMQPSGLHEKGQEKMLPGTKEVKTQEALGKRKQKIEPPSYAKQE